MPGPGVIEVIVVPFTEYPLVNVAVTFVLLGACVAFALAVLLHIIRMG